MLCQFWKGAAVTLTGSATAAVLDLASTNSILRGFNRGFTDGACGYLVPEKNGAPFVKVLRFLISGFVTVAVLDPALTAAVSNGFVCGSTDSTYVHLVFIYDGTCLGRLRSFRSAAV